MKVQVEKIKKEPPLYRVVLALGYVYKTYHEDHGEQYHMRVHMPGQGEQAYYMLNLHTGNVWVPPQDKEFYLPSEQPVLHIKE